MASKRLPKLEPVFPITEAYGYDPASPLAVAARESHYCPFAQNVCEKYRQYGFGYCSVTYAASEHKGERLPYAVCDHRLDGEPVRAAVRDYFQTDDIEFVGQAVPGALLKADVSPNRVYLVGEVVLPKPRRSFDYTAFRVQNGRIIDAMVIETQAIDLRGGGVGPAWQAWIANEAHSWRDYYTREFQQKSRKKDDVAYGVNKGNIYKRFGVQASTKGEFLKRCDVPLYIVMQNRPFLYLRERIPFASAVSGEKPEITFLTFEYTSQTKPDGTWPLEFTQKIVTTHEKYAAAMTGVADEDNRDRFLEAVARKAVQDGFTDKRIAKNHKRPKLSPN